MTKLYVLSLHPVNLKSLVMLKRFITLCFVVAIFLLVPYYLPLLVFGREDAPDDVLLIWCVGLRMIVLVVVCITLICMMFDYVVNGR